MGDYDFSFLYDLGLNKLINSDFTTLKFIANFYECNLESIRTIFKRNSSIFIKYGYKVLNGCDFEECREKNKSHFSSRARSVGLLNEECVVIFAYLLRKSDKTLSVIKHNEIKNYKFHQKMMELYTSKDFIKKYEKEMSFLIHSIFDKFHKIEEQVPCGDYYIDFVIDNKLAIECDENDHHYYDKNKEIDREKFIRKSGFEVIRYNTMSDNMLGFMGEISDFLYHIESKQ